MKILILAAGYATRLYPLTLDTPKSLLKLRNRPIFDYILDKIEALKNIDKVYVVTNHKFYKQFDEWLNYKNNGHPSWIKLINDGSTSVEDRRGAIGDIELVIKNENIKDDLLIIAGDNLFDFHLKGFIIFSNLRKPCHSICLYSAFDNMDLSGFGIAELNARFEILSFEEKPAIPKSHFVATCIYFFPKEKLSLIAKYLSDNHSNANITHNTQYAVRNTQNDNHHNDAPGSYIKWLTQNDSVYGYICNGIWYDLGNFDALTHALVHLNGDKHKVMDHQVRAKSLNDTHLNIQTH